MSFFNRQGWVRALLLAATVSAVCVSNVVAQNTTGISNDSEMLDRVTGCIAVEVLYRVAIGAQNGSIYVWKEIENYGGEDILISDWNEIGHSCGILFATMEDELGEEKFERIKENLVKLFKTHLMEKYQSNQQSSGGGGSGTFTDSRDGKTYKTVKIGKQTWMAQNLNYRAGNSWCYDNDNSNCNKYGRLYDWNTARTVCPAGWHLPSTQAWDNLALTLGGKRNRHTVEDLVLFIWDGPGTKLKAKSGWRSSRDKGTDDFGFSALPGGNRRYDGVFGSIGEFGNWWTATEGSSSNAHGRTISHLFNGVTETYSDKGQGYSVRCIMNN